MSELTGALVTGATGFVGPRLVAHLAQPHVLSRDPARAAARLGNVKAFGWDARLGPPQPHCFEGVDIVFHLAGEAVASGRWTAEKKRRILESRSLGTQALVSGIASASPRPKVLVSASAVGFYGDRGEEQLTEQSPPGNDFLAQVCQQWEQAARQAEALGVRVVTLRTGVVLGPGGGALAKMLPIFKLGLGGRLGSGRQWMPWVHVDDVVGMALWAATTPTVSGPLNAVSPQPVRNSQFTKDLAKTLHRPALFPAPALGLKMMVGEFAEILLASQQVLPAAALAAGYSFKFSELAPALANCLAAKNSAH